VASIHTEIHVEVRKLYEQATLPTFTVLSRDDRELRLFYQSPRAMEQLAQGLLEQAAVHYGEPCTISHATHDGPQGAGVLFILVKQAP